MPRTPAILALAFLLGSSEARAEPNDEAPAQTYEFEDDLVSGDLITPFGEILRIRQRGTRASLIEVRSSYIDKLLQSVEDL